MKKLIKDGYVIDTQNMTMERKDVLIEAKTVVAIDKNISPDADTQVINAEGKLVCPGLIDMHVHLREPGFEAKETIATGTLAAVHGGFSAVACMPNTNPVCDSKATVRFILDKARIFAKSKVYPIAAITKGSEGKEITEMADLMDAGAVAFSDDGQPVMDAGVMYKAMQYAKMLDAVIISHCEDKGLSSDGVMNEGYYSTILGLKGIPKAAEEIMVARDIILAKATKCRLHIAHVSTKGSVELVRRAKEDGINVTCEAAPHHFTLTDSAVEGYDTSTKVNPPLRSEEDVEAVKQGLADGTIDAIATDHAPHTAEEKKVEYQYAPFGLIGLETAVGLVFTELVDKGVLTPVQAVCKLTKAPADILKISGGFLTKGCTADITIIDPDVECTVNPEDFKSKARNTPFAGRRLKGAAVMTIVNGEVVFDSQIAFEK
ncbi:MAG: dihydroorotase [Desulfotomaculum sp.]|nr:dihydroorotase [Desulfotomaculum sp.]